MNATKTTAKKRGTKSALLTSLLSLLLCVSMLIGTTFAWFTDSVTSGDNVIVAGNLDMEVEHINAKVKTAESIAAATNLWNKDASGNDILWEPGVVSYETFTVKNLGTLALTYKLVLNQLANGKYNTVVSNDDSNGKSLKDVLYVHTENGAAAAARPATKMAEDDKTIAELLSTDAAVLSGSLEAGKSSDSLTVYIYWPTDSGNECNLQNGKYASDATAETVGKLWINLSVTATAAQYTKEANSFDNQYDKNATGGADDEDEDDSGALWFNTTVSGATPSDVKSIVFTTSAPDAAEYTSTWDSPANSKAYYNFTTKQLTYVPTGDSFKMTDDNLLKISGNVPVKGLSVEVTDEQIIDFVNGYFETTSYTDLDEAIAAFADDCGSDYGTREVMASIVEQYTGLTDALDFENVTSATGLELWDVSEVTDFSNMFSNTKITSLDISDWNIASAENMNMMFGSCRNLTTVKLGTNWNTAKVTNMSYMFYMCSTLTEIDSAAATWNTSKVTDMSYMFSNCLVITELPTAGWNTSSLENMERMFLQCKQLTSLDVSSFTTSNVTNMYGVFQNCEKLEALNLTNWNTANVTNMGYMFGYCKALTSLDLSGFNTSKVTNMGGMFAQCEKLTTLDLSAFNTSSVTDMSQMFNACYALEHIYVGSGWSMEAVTDDKYSESMFRSCTKLPNYDTSYYTYNSCPDKLHALTGTGGYLETKSAN